MNDFDLEALNKITGKVFRFKRIAEIESKKKDKDEFKVSKNKQVKGWAYSV
ncbi:MAG: hypothetical protein K8F52_04345 [Candidatus Scalindua rubra]|uniref:Uncharacterized protein n=1 Tax=Candidatus Scalindua brodae TaxID=237368 RepID=A0A0B0EKP1_9BACT|nr:MAG: hypothetical protein SCABRO_00672 [Candidatus Scalindua brodae]MBZ0107875.1 hypothetical protein [Candidatus Scalindua rubra]TWU29161.1 hypothetical protein S225a_25350 [Candidatus Brocadiaceae bacterium S225]